ncbi:unnamed protein product [Staurois parvus]|uniref:Uncharacterized protein n=1 Tax=Staurois parvus TaxID=386267 RepID=A0ABN9DHC6_9NEOB|nr:unnamed protein product [Staurois parvus]
MQNPSVWTVLIGPVLITCTVPRKENLSSNTQQTELVHVATGSVCLIRR